MNGRWRVLLQVILLGGFASLVGCGGGGGGNGNSSGGFSNPSSVVTIDRFSVDGNRPLLTGSIVPQVDSTIPSSFFVNWTITGNNVYTAHAFVSADNVLDSADKRRAKESEALARSPR